MRSEASWGGWRQVLLGFFARILVPGTVALASKRIMLYTFAPAAFDNQT